MRHDFLSRLHAFRAAMLLVLVITPCQSAMAFSGTVGVDAGYDDNASRTAQPQGSAFSRYTARLAQEFHLPENDIQVELNGEAARQDFFRLADNQIASVGCAATKPLLSGRITPAILARVDSLRNDLVEKDSRDSAQTGITLEWLASGRLTLELAQLIGWDDYTDWAAFRRRTAPHGGMATMDRERDDFQERTELSGRVHLGPNLETKFTIRRATISSSIASEEYRRLEGEAAVFWLPTASLRATAGFISGRDVFAHAGDMSERRDRHQKSFMRLGWLTGPLELSLQISQQDNRSTLPEEEYTQTVAQCGLAWSF